LRILETAEHPAASIFLLLSTIPDIHLAIFDHLDLVSSTCLGLTCKYFYRLHIAKWGLKVSLVSRSDRPTPFVLKSCWDEYANSTEEDYVVDLTEYVERVKDRVHLCACIKDWIGPELVFWLEERKYVREENINTVLALFYVGEDCTVFRFLQVSQ
jgi:hypothetical protein